MAASSAPEQVPFDEMKLKHIEEMVEVAVTVENTDLNWFDVTDFVMDEYRGQVKTRASLISSLKAEQGGGVKVTVYGYVCAQTHHSETTIRDAVTTSARDAFGAVAADTPAVEVVFGPRHAVEETTGATVLTDIETKVTV